MVCSECKGSGAAPGSKAETCRQCNGTGQVRRSQGFFQIAMPCPVCQGSGQMITKPCPKCKGEGIVAETRELVVRVPAGVDTGTRLRVRGEGEPGAHGGPAGDLYVVLTVEQDKRWQRQGQNLIYSHEISFVQAALGHRIEVPGLEGPLPLEIPKGIQSGTLLRLSGEGLPAFRNGKWNSCANLSRPRIRRPCKKSKKRPRKSARPWAWIKACLSTGGAAPALIPYASAGERPYAARPWAHGRGAGLCAPALGRPSLRGSGSGRHAAVVLSVARAWRANG